MNRIPALLILLRILLGPSLILACAYRQGPAVILSLLVAAMLSDIFDGVIARRLNIATAPLRVADSWADAWFFLCVGVSAWITSRDVIRAYATPVVAEIVLQSASYTYDLARYRRISSLHAYSAKLWGFSLYVAAGSLIAFRFGALLWVSFAFGLISFVDALAIKQLLPGWRHDVLSCLHAWRMSKQE